MRIFAPHLKQTRPLHAQAGPNASPAPTPHRPLHRAWGNQTSQRLYTPAAPSKAPVKMVPQGAAQEKHARAVGEQARHTAPEDAALLSGETGAGTQMLTPAGRRFFEPLVGTPLADARVHQTARADRLTHLTRAKALTYGRDVFLPRTRPAPSSEEGRALLAHELTHVGQKQPGPPALYRSPELEPHYPTIAEQKEIENLLSRELKPTNPGQPQPTGSDPNQTPVVERGRALSKQEQQKMADQLKSSFFSTLDGLLTDTAGPAPGTLKAPEAITVVNQARDDILAMFGSYSSRTISLTQNANTTAQDRIDAQQILVVFGSSPAQQNALAYTILFTHCTTCRNKLATLNDDAKSAVATLLTTAMRKERGADLKRATDANVPGSHNDDLARILIQLRPRQELYGTAVHELMHAMAHPAFRAAFTDERNILEGFTEYFTRQVVSGTRSSYPEAYAKVKGVRNALSGPFLFPLNGANAEESLRLAYFQGRLELIGWRPSGPQEQEAVDAAGGSAKWDPKIAQQHAPKYEAQAQAAQGASRNVLGVGLYFPRQSASDPLLTVRYARVLLQSKPYARWQLGAEGQLLGTPIQNPRALGASLGLTGTYQEPYFYAGGGIRFAGTAVPTDGTTQLDLSPFVGAGVRAWQRIRVGGEGFVVLPLTGQSVSYGGGVTFGVEFD